MSNSPRRSPRRRRNQMTYSQAREILREKYDIIYKPNGEKITWFRLLEAYENITDELRGEGIDVYRNLLTNLRLNFGVYIHDKRRDEDTFRPIYDRLEGYIIYTLYHKGIDNISTDKIYDQLDFEIYGYSRPPRDDIINVIGDTLYDYWGEDEE